jgi:hypothetical protein
MDPAAALNDWLDRLTFTDLSGDEVTARLIDEVAAWGDAQGWRVYRRAPSVVPLPPPLERQHSVLDVACARPDGPPVVIEIDHTDRRRTVDKLLAEARAGRVPIWVRWGTGRFHPPPPPVTMVICAVTRRAGLFTKVTDGHRPPPQHSTLTAEATAVPMPIPMEDEQ